VTAFLVFLVAGVGSFIQRASFIIAIGDRRLPDLVEKALRHVGPAVLSALTVSLLLSPDPAAFFGSPGRIVGTVLAVALAWWTKNYALTMAAGMAAFWLLGGG
jgi:branched-subunit amino acid transport protein